MISCLVISYNESKHIERCVNELKKISDDIVVVDSFSDDNTRELASNLGARVLTNEWVNHSFQINWAINNIDFKNEFIFRVDADEYPTPELVNELNENTLASLKDSVNGVYIKRRTYFLGKWIKHGGYYPTTLLRIWRKGYAVCENREMDEHMVLSSGESVTLENDFIDDNISSITDWINKHNQYSNKELAEYNKLKPCGNPSVNLGPNTNKRNLKSRYYSSPIFLRTFLYFLYRYFYKLGFLDGREGLIFHVLQGFWYRFLVDAKIYEKNGNK